MKIIQLIDKIEHSKSFWALLWITLFFFLLRLPSLIEPNWYGDEGIYQIIGRVLHNGGQLYIDIWDNKPPLLYLIHALFNGDQFSIRFASLIVGIVTVWSFFGLSQHLFKKIKISVGITILFAILFSIPLTEGNIANAENFMLLPIMAGALIIIRYINHKPHHEPSVINYKLLFAGFLLGLAFLLKIVAVFDLAAFLCFLVIISFPEKFTRARTKESRIKQYKSFVISMLHDPFFILLGFLVPLLITTGYFALHNSLLDFFRATFLGNIGYVNYGNTFIIPQGLMIIKLFLLGCFLLFVFFKRHMFSHASLFVLLWTAFSLFNALFSQRPYTHYVLVLLPAFCLFIGLLIAERKANVKKLFLLFFIGILVILFSTFKLTNIKKTFLYYQNAVLFVLGQRDIQTYQSFFDSKTPRDYQLASYIKMKNKPNDPLFVWGDSAQIYVLSETQPIIKYTVAYHIRQQKDGILMTQKAINTIRPKYVIILAESPNFSFKLDGYVSKFSLEKAVVYERISQIHKKR